MTAAPRGAAAAVRGDRRGNCNPPHTGSTTAAAAGVPEGSAPAHSTTAEMPSSTVGAAAQKTLGRDRGEFDMGASVGDAPLMTTTTADPTPNSGRAAPPGSETSRRQDVRGGESVRAAARHCDRDDGGAIEDDPPAAARVSPPPGDVLPEVLAVATASVADLISRPLTAPEPSPPPPWPPNPDELDPVAACAPGAARGGAPAP